MTSNFQELEKRLENVRNEQALYSNNRYLIASKVTALRQKLNQIHIDEQTAIKRLQQPLIREEDSFARETKEYERAKNSFVTAETEFKKAESHYDRKQADITKMRDILIHNSDQITKKFDIELKRLEKEIERREQEERSYAAKAENMRRNVELLQRRLEEAKHQETEQLKRNAANTNAKPTNGHDAFSFSNNNHSQAANDNETPYLHRYRA